MRPEEDVFAAVESVRNLRPTAFALATDINADVKARWKAFDELYEAVLESLAARHESPEELLSLLPDGQEWPVGADLDRQRRVRVALLLLMRAFGVSEVVDPAVLYEAEVLVPTPPDPDTGMPRLTMRDQAALQIITSVLRQDMPDDCALFFRASSEPVEKRRTAFRRLYLVAAKSWMVDSLFARRMEPIHRQRFIVLALMCHVPHDQWTQSDLEDLWAELLPVDEPDWHD